MRLGQRVCPDCLRDLTRALHEPGCPAQSPVEPVERVLDKHQPSETPGRCSCGFWEVTQHADHQAAMLRAEGALP